MDPRKQAFLTAVLGADGAGALMKAVERSAVLEFALVPRTILAWIQLSPEHEGALPGIEGSSASFQKFEAGFTGKVQIGEVEHGFEHVSVFHVAASVGVAMGVDADNAPADLRDLDLERLGKSIDSLAKLRHVTNSLEKADEPECSVCAEGKEHGNHGGDGAAAWYKPVHEYSPPKQKFDVKKDELLEKQGGGAGPAAAPQAPKPPVAPAAAGSTPKPSLKPAAAAKPPTVIKMSKSEAARRCPACGIGQFKDGKFHGCICFRAMNKAVKVVPSDADSVAIELDPRIWDKGDVVTFLEAIGRR